MQLDVLLLLLNVAGTVGIVFANKCVFAVFPFPMAVTFLHAVTQGLFLMARTGACRPKAPLPLLTDCWIAVLTIGCIYLTNLSLRINSVDMYQIFKLMNIPTICMFQYVVHNKRHSVSVYLSLVVLTIGVAASTIAEFNLGLTGLGFAAGMAGVLVTVIDQMEVTRLKAKHKADSVAFLHSNMYHRMAFGASVVLTTEFDALATAPSMPTIAWIGLASSCMLAVVINLTQISILGRFGPLTLNVVGQVKTITILALGMAWTRPALDLLLARKVGGVIVAMAGAIKYGQLTSMPESRKEESKAKSDSKMQ